MLRVLLPLVNNLTDIVGQAKVSFILDEEVWVFLVVALADDLGAVLLKLFKDRIHWF